MVTDGCVYNTDKDDMVRWFKYIFYHGVYGTAYARISRRSTAGEEEMPEADRYPHRWKEYVPSGTYNARVKEGLLGQPDSYFFWRLRLVLQAHEPNLNMNDAVTEMF